MTEGARSWPTVAAVWLFWLSLALLTAGSLMPGEMLPPQAFDVWDKAQHALGFAWVTAWGLVAFGRRAPALVAGLLLWGAAIETLQAASGWRQGDVLDALANAVGITLASLVWRGLRAARDGRR